MLMNRSRMRGFSLIEMLVVIAILAIVAGLAAPSFQQIVINSRIRTGADGILSGLQLARAEAVRRNANVSFTMNTGTGWTIADAGGTAIQTRPTSEAGSNLVVTLLNSQDSLAFGSDGRVNNYNTASNLSKVTISSTQSGTDSYQIDIKAGGLIKMCNPGITANNDPRKC